MVLYINIFINQNWHRLIVVNFLLQFSESNRYIFDWFCSHAPLVEISLRFLSTGVHMNRSAVKFEVI